MPQFDRRSMMLMSGIGCCQQRSHSSQRGRAHRIRGQFRWTGGLGARSIEVDDLEGREKRCRTHLLQNCPRTLASTADRRNVYVDGKSNLVIKAFKEGNTYYGGKVNTTWEGGVGHLGSPDQVRVPDAGAWPAFWLSSDASGEIDVVEWYGNGNWPSATTVAAANGSRMGDAEHHRGHRLAWRVQWDTAGMRFWKDYTDGAAPYFDVPADSGGLAVQQPRLQGVPDLQPRGRRFRRR